MNRIRTANVKAIEKTGDYLVRVIHNYLDSSRYPVHSLNQLMVLLSTTDFGCSKISSDPHTTPAFLHNPQMNEGCGSPPVELPLSAVIIDL